MAITVISVVDESGTDQSNGGCLEDVDGNVTITIDAPNLNPDSVANNPAYVDGTLVDNGDGTWSFESDPSKMDGQCFFFEEFDDVNCAESCPSYTISQTVNGSSVSADITIVSEFTIVSTELNGVTYTGGAFSVDLSATGDCVDYSFTVLDDKACLYTFTANLPLCDYTLEGSACENQNACTGGANQPSLSYDCLENGDIQVTTTPGGAIASETTYFSSDGNVYTEFVSIFTPQSEVGFIKYVVDYEDACPPKEIIEQYICTTDCENIAECACVYDQAANTFTSTCTDTFTATVLTETTVYYIDGNTTPVNYTLGSSISAVGINRIDFKRVVTFQGACEDLELEWSCSKVDEDCDYGGYDLSCIYDENTQSVTPTFSGDDSILDTSEKYFSVDGGVRQVYAGGSVVTNKVALFFWKIQIEGCEPEILTSFCSVPCPCTGDIVVEPPIVNVEPPIVNVEVPAPNVTVNVDACCEEEPPPNPCPDPTRKEGTSNVVRSTHLAFGIAGSYFTTQNFIHWQTNNDTYVAGGGGTSINNGQCGWDAPHPQSPLCSRLNKVGIWTDDTSADKVVFALCFNVERAGTYSIGFAADNAGFLKIDGETTHIIENNGGTPTMQQRAFKRWFVLEKQLTAGQHLIQMEAEDLGSAQTVGFEIYNATTAQLQQLSTPAEIDAMVIAHSAQIDNTNLVFGVAGGLECPTGTTPGYDGCSPICECVEGWDNIAKVYLNDVRPSVDAATIGAMNVTSVVVNGVEKMTTPIALTHSPNITHLGTLYNPSLVNSLNQIFTTLGVTEIMADLPTLKDMQHLTSPTSACQKRHVLKYKNGTTFSIKVDQFTYTHDSCMYENSNSILGNYGCYIDFNGTGERFVPFDSMPD